MQLATSPCTWWVQAGGLEARKVGGWVQAGRLQARTRVQAGRLEARTNVTATSIIVQLIVHMLS